MNRFKLFLYSQILVFIFLGIAFHFFGLPNFFSKTTLNERVLENQDENISFSGTVVGKVNGEKGKFLIKNKVGKEFISSSKNLDLNNYLLENISLEGEIFFNDQGKKYLDVKKISLIEGKKNKEPKNFFLENKFGGYGFQVDENIFTALRGGSKTFLKNGSGETILKFFSYQFSGKGNFFSDGGNLTSLNGFEGEIKSLDNGQEIFLKNPKKPYGVLVQIDYGKNIENLESTKKQVYNFLQSFEFTEKENISKEKCGGKEGIVCGEGYFCELFSVEKNASGRCVEL